MDILHHNRALVAVVCLLICGLGCSPVAVAGRHPDEVLFERGMDAAEQEHFAVAHLTLETLLDTYPDSEYGDRARLALQDPRLASCGGWTTSPGCEVVEPVWRQ